MSDTANHKVKWQLAPGYCWCNVLNYGVCVAKFDTIKQAERYINKQEKLEKAKP